MTSREKGATRSPDAVTIDDMDLDVEKVLGEQKRKGGRWLHLKWKSFDDSYNSWEPLENVQMSKVVRAWRKNKGETVSESSGEDSEQGEEEDRAVKEDRKEEDKIESILAHIMGRRRRLYHVKWMGSPNPKDFTWEPAANINVDAQYEQYKNSIGETKELVKEEVDIEERGALKGQSALALASYSTLANATAAALSVSQTAAKAQATSVSTKLGVADAEQKVDSAPEKMAVFETREDHAAAAATSKKGGPAVSEKNAAAGTAEVAVKMEDIPLLENAAAAAAAAAATAFSARADEEGGSAAAAASAAKVVAAFAQVPSATADPESQPLLFIAQATIDMLKHMSGLEAWFRSSGVNKIPKAFTDALATSKSLVAASEQAEKLQNRLQRINDLKDKAARAQDPKKKNEYLKKVRELKRRSPGDADSASEASPSPTPDE